MSGRYRYEPSNGWLWLLPPVGPSFASVYEKSASGADSNSRAVREVVIELNRLLDRAVYAESHRLTAETALDEAIARADKASNALIRTTAALRETTDRAEKAEARVAELEREVAAWSPARHYGPEDDAYDPKPIWHTLADGTRIPRCPTHGYDFATEEWGASSPPVLLRVTCQRCSWASGPIERTPQSPTGASGGDPGPEGGEGAQPPGPVLGHPRGFGSTDTLTIGQTPAERPVYGSCRGCKGLTPDPEIPFCAMCCDLGRGGASKKDLDHMREVIARRATTCEDVKCPCVEEHGPVTLTDEDRVDLTKPQTLRAYATFGEASPENSIRILVDPAAAAEVEARTGAYVTRSAGVVTVTAIDGVIVEVRHPRAGLPSRDEVAAFLEGLKPPEPPAESRPCQRCRKPLPPERTWFHAECMDPKVKQ